MKALILAAGFGTRLMPYTRTLPKPLFTVNNRPVLDLAIGQLLASGCHKIFINTHHLAGRIREFARSHPARHSIEIVHEPRILDTGGAIANLRSRLKDDDFFVVNADILSDADLLGLMAAHKSHSALATLLVHDCPRFNRLNVAMDGPDQGCVAGFDQPPGKGLAFTGIQVVSPEIFAHFPDKEVFSSIDLYRALCPTGRIRAVKAAPLFWQDMGTPDDYAAVSRQCLAGEIFGLPRSGFKEVAISPIAGDGSDRAWFRAVHGPDTLVISDHGISIGRPDVLGQLRAFVCIGRHLNGHGLAVPRVLGHDEVAGLVALEDLGTVHLADLVPGKTKTEIFTLYCRVIDALIGFSQIGIQGFDPDWTCQTRTYSKALILDMECRYFMEAFVNGYLGREGDWKSLLPSFSHIADNALAHGYQGLMHRDLQSRNIMIRAEKPWFIDFQSARIGPVQYDLASLLIDPYVKLPREIRDRLLAYAMTGLGVSSPSDSAGFRRGFDYCAIARNLQMLGAFGFLSRVKRKPWFETFIPDALAGLKQRLGTITDHALAPLAEFVHRL